MEMRRGLAFLLAAALTAWSANAFGETITLLCKGDAFAPTLGGQEIETGRLVIDTDTRSLMGPRTGGKALTEGERQETGTNGTTMNCRAAFGTDEASYSMIDRCAWAQPLGTGAVNVLMERRWLLDRATGHLNFDWRLGTSTFAKTADCVPMDLHPRF